MTMRYESIALAERCAALSLDLEEDHAGLSPTLRYEAAERLPEIAHWLRDNKIPLSVFVSANFLERQGRVVENLPDLEYHSHGYWHPPHDQMWNKEVREKNIRDGLRIF